jgi:hypothetical protein
MAKPNEALASKARDTLQQILIPASRTVLLQYDSEQHDHYGPRWRTSSWKG